MKARSAYKLACAIIAMGLALSGLRPAAAEYLLPQSVEQVNAYTTSDQRPQSVAPLGDGSVLFVYESVGQDGDSAGVFARRQWLNTMSFDPEFQVNTFTTGDQSANSDGQSQVGVQADGRFVIVWSSYGQDGTDSSVYAQRYSAAGAAEGSEFLVNTYTTNGQNVPRIATRADGRSVVVWFSVGQDGSGSGVYGQVYDSDGTPTGTEFPVNDYTVGNQRVEGVAWDADDRFIVAWDGVGPSDDDGIHARVFDENGAAVTGDFRVNESPGHEQWYASVAGHNDGGFVVVWTSFVDQAGNSSDIFARRIDHDGAPVSGEFLVNAYTSDRQSYPTIATAKDGTFLVVWQDRRDTIDANEDVYGTLLSADGAVIQDDISISAIAPGRNNRPKVSSDGESGFIVTWTNCCGNDGDGYAALARHLRAVECPASPQIGCKTAATGSLRIKDSDDESKDSLVWQWKDGEGFAHGDIPAPTETEAYSLCVYDETAGVPALAASLVIAPHAEKWKSKSPHGYTYSDSGASSDGIRKAIIRAGDPGKTRVQVKARGSSIDMPTPVSAGQFFNQDARVVSQLLSQSGICWSSAFSTDVTNRNEASRFSARIP